MKIVPDKIKLEEPGLAKEPPRYDEHDHHLKEGTKPDTASHQHQHARKARQLPGRHH